MDDGVDYLWSNSLHVTSITEVDKIKDNLPNQQYPSDHISLHASYNL